MSDVPHTSADWPPEVKAYLKDRALRRLYEDHGGWEGLAQWLYMGMKDAEGVTIFAPKFAMLWPTLKADAEAWAAQKRSAQSQGRGTV